VAFSPRRQIARRADVTEYSTGGRGARQGGHADDEADDGQDHRDVAVGSFPLNRARQTRRLPARPAGAPACQWEPDMLNATTLLAEELGQRLSSVFLRTFGGAEPQTAALLDEAARLIIEWLASSDALYHNAEHTALVTLVAQDILRGLRIKRTVSPDEWLHFIVAALTHDIGYLRGVCPGDTAERQVIDAAGNTIPLSRGASDASLAPYHVFRSQLVVQHRFASHAMIDGERVARAIELTRFPVPDDDDHRETNTQPGLMRAADLIGQLGDPLYPRKLNALFHEFAEIGINEKLGYANPADVAERYPSFFWNRVEPYIGDAIRYLEYTMEGRQWVAQLYSNVFAIEHHRQHMGPLLTGSRTP
jgi:hypothetical protein